MRVRQYRLRLREFASPPYTQAMSIPAKLPAELVRPEPRTLRSMANGESTFIVFTHMFVAADGSCYLYVDADLRQSHGINNIAVRKGDDGAFHVTIPADSRITYIPGKLMPSDPDEMVPVASVTLGEDE